MPHSCAISCTIHVHYNPTTCTTELCSQQWNNTLYNIPHYTTATNISTIYTNIYCLKLCIDNWTRQTEGMLHYPSS